MTHEEQLLKDEYGIVGIGALEMTMNNLIESKVKADETINKIKAISKSRQAPKTYKSPYAKFDKFHKKKRK